MELSGAFSLFLLRKHNIWYSVQNGNWSDPNTWVSNGKRKKLGSPQTGDTVYINHTVKYDITPFTVNNLYIAGKLTIDDTGARQLFVTGDMQVTGTLDMTSSNQHWLILSGFNNFINGTFTPGSSGIAYLSGNMQQAIMPITYQHLLIRGNGTSPVFSITKYLQANLTVNGNFYCGCICDCKGFSVSVTGQTTVSGPAGSSVSGNSTGSFINASSILFIGLIIDGGGAAININTTVTPVEMRGGFSGAGFDFSTADINLTTNNQTLSDAGIGTVIRSLKITGAITITNTSNLTLPTIDGTVAGSTFNNNATVIFTTSTAPMATAGVFNYRNASNTTIGYKFNGSFTLPYTLYENLIITSTSGIKTLTANTVLNFGLTCNGNLELGTFDFTIGTTFVTNAVGGLLSKSGSGTVIFGGSINGGGSSGGIDFSAGNPIVELRGGIVFNSLGYNFGTGNLSFTTNNQNIFAPNTSDQIFNGNITIATGITVTTPTGTNAIIFNGVLNGASSTAIYINNGVTKYQNATAPMATGKLYCNQAANTFFYSLNGAQDITPPSDPVSPGYKNLTLNTGGVKRLLGNVSVKGTYLLSAPATLNSNGFALTNP